MEGKLRLLADKITTQRFFVMTKSCKDAGIPYDAENVMRLHGESSIIATIKPGLKYTKIDVGRSGKYMVDREGNIFGVKAYGQIHRGHQYGTLDTINDWYWGDYTARPVGKEVAKCA